MVLRSALQPNHAQRELGSQTCAVILAGGGGRRLGGVCKAQLRMAGSTLLQRAAAVLRPDATALVVSSGCHEAGRFQVPGGIDLVPDGAFSGFGPSGGLLAVASYVREHMPQIKYLLTLAVDTVWAPPGYARRLAAHLTAEHSVAIATSRGQAYPTNALWRMSALTDLLADPANLAGKGLGRIFDAKKQALVEFPPSGAVRYFANINSIRDLIDFAAGSDALNLLPARSNIEN